MINKQEKVDGVCRCETFARVSGYYRPVSQFNRGKEEEFRRRVLPQAND